MCYQLEQLLVYLQSQLLSLESQERGDLPREYTYDEEFDDGILSGQIITTIDIIKKIEEMLAASKCKGNHLS